MTLLGKVLALGVSFFTASAISGVVGAFVDFTPKTIVQAQEETKQETTNKKESDDIDPGAVFA